MRLAMSMLDVDDRSVERRRNYLKENVVLSKEMLNLVLWTFARYSRALKLAHEVIRIRVSFIN